MASPKNAHMYHRMSYTVIGSIINKILHFSFNVYVVRTLSRTQFGLSARLRDLCFAPLVSLCCDGIRTIMFRFEYKNERTKILQLAWLVSAVVVFLYPIAYVLNAKFVFDASDERSELSVHLFCLSAIFEVMAFPLSIPLLFDASLVPMAIGLFVNTANSILTLFFVLFWGMGVSALAASQLICSILQFFLYIGVNSRQKRVVFPEFAGFWPLVKSALFKNAFRFGVHNALNVFKGSVWNLVDIRFFSSEGLGLLTFIYAEGNILRTIFFLPLLQQLQIEFFQISETKESIDINLKNLKKAFQNALKISVFVALLAISVGKNYVNCVVYVIYGSKWLRGGLTQSLLSTFCYYLLVLALNDVTNAFLMAFMLSEDVDKRFMFAFVADVLILAFTPLISKFIVLLRLDEETKFRINAKIFANTLSPVIEIIYAINYARRKMEISLTEWIYTSFPPVRILIGLVLARMVTNFSYRFFSVDAVIKGEKEVRLLSYLLYSVVPHVFVGGVMALVVASWYIRIMYNEKE